MRMSRVVPILLAIALASAQVPATGQQMATVDLAQVDSLFERFDGTRNPGCAVGVSEGGYIILERAYGMADLEHDVPNGPETVFEPGSVSKQFTAAATILLALDGKLALDDDVRKYIPELPEYEAPITVRHLLNHTSGLRDWGSVAGIEGWPRTTRVHTHTHMLDIASRQNSLNYQPGDYYSYTNTGYNLQAVLVERVSGMSFAEFSQQRIFEPLGMTKTEWRDDFTRIVKDRSIGYSPNRGGGWSMLMPFENVHGNGGLLTTVGDLLRFTHNLETGELGGPRFLEEMHRQGVLNSGRTIAYASGLFIGEYKGVREVQHSGGTAAYRGFLTRFPDQGLAVSVMCNAGNANPGRLARQVAELYLGDALSETEPTVAGEIDLSLVRLEPVGDFEPTAAQLTEYPGTYRSPEAEAVYRVEIEDGALVLKNRYGEGRQLTPVYRDAFTASRRTFIFHRDGAGQVTGMSWSESRVWDLRFERMD